MADNFISPNEGIPEADALEQLAPLDPNDVIDTSAALTPDSTASVVDEADRLEQQAVVSDDGEDDYPHD